jgi:hypothetical protein
MEYILYSKKGGWFTKTSQLHSDWRKAQVFTDDEAVDMGRLHNGMLLPVDKAHYEHIMKGVKE